MTEPRRAAPPAEPSGWLGARERGGVLAIRLTVFIATVLGRSFGRFVSVFVALYYTLTSPGPRRAIRAFHARVRGGDAARPVSFLDVYRHLLRFVRVTLDAFFFVSGKGGAIPITRTGTEYLQALRDEKRGAVLLGAHLGSFYAMRGQGTNERLPLYALVYTKNARMLNEALEKLDPKGAAHLLQLDSDGGFDSMLRAKELLDQGAIIAIMGDRIPANASPDRIIHAPFFGADAPFSAGPLLLASMLKCPVYLTFGIARDPDGYDLYCEPFADRIDLPRGDRQAALERYVVAYAARLEHYAKKAPDNWFNFYDFWSLPAPKQPASALTPPRSTP